MLTSQHHFMRLVNRSVHDQVSRSGWVSRANCHLTRFSTEGQNFAEFFAELRAPEAPIVPVCSSVLR